MRIVLRKLLIVHLDSGTCAGFRQSRTGGRQNQGRFFSFLPWISNCGNHLTPVCRVTIIHILCLPLESTQSPLDDISPNLINLMLQDKLEEFLILARNCFFRLIILNLPCMCVTVSTTPFYHLFCHLCETCSDILFNPSNIITLVTAPATEEMWTWWNAEVCVLVKSVSAKI